MYRKSTIAGLDALALGCWGWFGFYSVIDWFSIPPGLLAVSLTLAALLFSFFAGYRLVDAIYCFHRKI